MYYPTRRYIEENIGKTNLLVPVYRELKGLEDPLDVFSRLYNGGYAFLLESARHHPKIGRYSFLGISPYLVFSSKGRKIRIYRNGREENIEGDPIRKLKEISDRYSAVRLPGLPNFTGGGVGYFSYEVRHFFEELPKAAIDDVGLPDIFFMFMDTIVAFDHYENKAWVISHFYPEPGGNSKSAYDRAVEKIESVVAQINSPEPLKPKQFEPGHPPGKNILPRSNFTREGFEEIVRQAKEHIAAGDIYQANLSQRLWTDFSGDPLYLYRVLREINPSPFACYLDCGSFHVVSCSPERLVKLDGQNVDTRPIAGTRPRGKTEVEDRDLSRELILNPKERAEHIMLLDLERNDLGRVCEYGSVRVDELMAIEEYSHVFHIVSNVQGRLAEGKDRFSLLRSMFPGGTITGCPKIRCMEIIDELEPVQRGLYTGSIGYLSFNGDMDLNIVIRTFVLTGGRAYIQVGAGIVADSDPEREYFETLYKAEALLKTLDRVNNAHQLQQVCS